MLLIRNFGIQGFFRFSNFGIEGINQILNLGNESSNKGMIFENMVAQELRARDRSLVFSKFKVEGVKNFQEVDFLIANGKSVIPLECKSGYSGEHASLDRYMVKYKDVSKHAYVIHSKDVRVDGNTTYIPIYMTMFL